MYQSTLNALLCLILALAARLVSAESEAGPVFDAAKAKQPEYLRATTIVTNSQNHSQFQCWVFRTPFTVSAQPGVSGAATLDLAKLSNVTYAVVPPKFDGGRHNAPYKQIVVFLSGTAVLSLPHSDQAITVQGGANGLIVAIDVTGSGHITTYPSNEQTRALELPFPQDKVPEHFVTRRNGPCQVEDQVIY